jgi:hypothetical protein
MKISEDETLFAWGSNLSSFITGPPSTDVLASDPKDFSEAKELIPFASDEPAVPYTMTHRGLRIWLPMFNTQQLDDNDRNSIRRLRSPVMVWSRADCSWAILRCHVVHDFHHSVVIPLRHMSADIFICDKSSSVSLIPTESLPAFCLYQKDLHQEQSHLDTLD